MPSSTIPAIKVISTLGLGLLSGYAIASPLLITPTISSLSTASTASRLTERHLLSSHVTTTGSCLLSTLLSATYLLSPSVARHPYLIYAAVLSASTAAVSYTFGAKQIKRIGELSQGTVNGERVTSEFDTLRKIGSVVATLITLAFGVSVVGNYGDFY